MANKENIDSSIWPEKYACKNCSKMLRPIQFMKTLISVTNFHCEAHIEKNNFKQFNRSLHSNTKNLKIRLKYPSNRKFKIILFC